METLRAGYQGHVYKKACESLEDENLKLFASRFIFAGFNALSKSEEKVIQTLLERGIGSV